MSNMAARVADLRDEVAIIDAQLMSLEGVEGMEDTAANLRITRGKFINEIDELTGGGGGGGANGT